MQNTTVRFGGHAVICPFVVRHPDDLCSCTSKRILRLAGAAISRDEADAGECQIEAPHHTFQLTGRAAMKTLAIPMRAILALATLVTPAVAQSRQQAVEIRHEGRKAVLVTRNGGAVLREDTLQNGGEVRLRSPRTAPIRVVGTNSALYTCSAVQTKAAVPEIEQTRGFLAAFGAYLPDMLKAVPYGALPRDVPDAKRGRINAAADNVRIHLARFASAAAELNQVRTHTLLTLEAMRTMQGVETSAASLRKQVHNQLQCPAGTCSEFRFVDDMLGSLQSLVPATAALNAVIESNPGSATPQHRQIADAAAKVVENADKIVAAAYSTESLAATAMNAKSTIDCDTVRASTTEGRDVVITVAPRAMPETQRIANRAPLEFKAKVLPRLAVVPAVGLSLLYAPEASYPKFGTVPAGDSAEIIESGTQNSRANYGLTLGAKFRGFSERSMSLYLPELTINPSSDVRAIGLGGAVSLGVLKLGAGRLWTKHTVLDEQQVGNKLRHAAFFRTRETYGSPRTYFSFSIIGWPPFLNPK